VFSTLAAFTTGPASSTDLGLGAMLGAAMYVFTLVLGLVLLSTSDYVQVSMETFGKDIKFLALAVCLLLLLHLSGVGASVLVGTTFICLYLVYVVLVVVHSRSEFRR
jgi:Ca2+/Na+ antiporter